MTVSDITAEDVQFSFDALANPDVGSAYTQSFLDAVASWRVIDADTFEVVAKEPLYTFLHNVANWIIPKHIWETVPVADWRTDPGATGQDPVAGGRLRGLEVPGVATGRERDPRSQRRLLSEGALPRLLRHPHLAGPDSDRQRPPQRRGGCG